MTEKMRDMKLMRSMSNLDEPALKPMRKSRRVEAEESIVAEYAYFRRQLHFALTWPYTEKIIGGVIIVNFIVIILEADVNAGCSLEGGDMCSSPVFQTINYILLSIYIMEATVRIFVHRINYFLDLWNLFDFVIIIVGLADVIMVVAASMSSLPGLSMLRLFRVARLVRAAKLLRIFPELQTMMKGFASAILAMLWGFLAIVLILLMWSVLSVELLNNVNQEINADVQFCKDMFSSVSAASLMFFQTLVAGDSWGMCAVPLVQKEPASAILFAGALVTVSLGLTNLILAVIVEKAQDAKEADKVTEAASYARTREEAQSKLQEMCEEIDRNGDGVITLRELKCAYRDHQEMKAVFETLDIDEEDLDSLFRIIDVEGSGALTYQELVGCIHKADHDDLKRQMMMLRIQIQNIWLRVREHLEVKLDLIRDDICGQLNGSSQNATAPTQRTGHSDKHPVDAATCDTLRALQRDTYFNDAVRSPFADLRMQLDQLSQHLQAELTNYGLAVDAKEKEVSALLQKVNVCGQEDARDDSSNAPDEEIQSSKDRVQARIKAVQRARGIEPTCFNSNSEASNPVVDQSQSDSGTEQNHERNEMLEL